MDLPLVSIVIPVWNDWPHLWACLEALQRQDYPSSRVEIVVVDNDPLSGAGERSRLARGLVCVTEAIPGSYRARNRGVQVSHGEVLAFTDADCLPASDWIATGVRRLGKMKQVGFLAGSVQVVPRDASRPTLAERYDIVASFPQEEYVRKGHFGTTANLFTAREVFRQVGPFDGRLLSGGDVEWGRRVYASGRELAYAEEVRVVHPARASMADLIRKARRVAGGMVQVERSRPGRLTSDQVREFLPNPSFVRRLRRSRSVRDPWSRTLLFALHLGLRQVKFWERLRIVLGGRPLR